ncbi:SgcJ/EcaC family oxidoreductase [Curtobacterium citreum]|uniref:SgcJ/EcaC family oxidoreductase n=1 Tax=Curtobacterium citreum TaxID=2036 RepID=A0ABU8Y885_9MICO
MTNTDTPAAAAGVVDAYSRALQASDKAAILALYTDESEVVPEGGPSVRGMDAIDAFYTDTLSTIGFENDLQVVSSQVRDDIAIFRSEQPIIVTTVADGTSTPSYFRELFVLRRTADGWRINTYMFSQNPGQA